MGDRDNPPTCLSSYQHDRAIRDASLHYFGCLKDKDRAIYFEGLSDVKKRRIKEEEELVRSLRSKPELQEQISNIRDLRIRFRNTPSSKPAISIPNQGFRNTQHVATASGAPPAGIDQAQTYQRTAINNQSASQGDELTASLFIQGTIGTGGPVGPTADLDSNPDLGYGIKASMIFFKDSKPYKHPLSEDEFPDQKIPLRDLVYEKDDTKNPLMQPCDKDMIRYFHLPANNMEWVEVSRLSNTY